MRLINKYLGLVCMLLAQPALAQETDSLKKDNALRITNLSPYITHHTDSVFVYRFTINKNPADYYWYLSKAPVGLTIGKENGVLNFRAAKNYFLSGRLKYDYPYRVDIGVQSLANATEKTDSSFSIVFYSTEIFPSALRPSVAGTIYIDEGETVSFRLQCENGSFAIDNILFNSNIPIANYTAPTACGQAFSWTPGYEFVRETDSGKVKVAELIFTGATKFKLTDPAVIRIIVRDGLNYPMAAESHGQLTKNIRLYILQLKYSFLQLDKKLKKVKGTRLAFDLTSASTALTGTILNSSSDPSSKRAGQILPSVGLAINPIKEAAAPNKSVEQNQAALIRTCIKRLEYMVQDNSLTSDRDPDIFRKTQKLKDELKQVQVQLIDIPVDITNEMSEEELNNYFINPKVNKKYRLK